MKSQTKFQNVSSIPKLLCEIGQTPRLWLLLVVSLFVGCSGDPDTRPGVRVPVHIYNSSGRDISVTVTEKNAPEEKRLKWNILMPPNVGRKVQISRADTYTFKVAEDETLNYTFEVPQGFKEAVLLDFGSRGEFKLEPVFYKGEQLSDDEAKQRIVALTKEKGLETIFITEKAPFHKLPVRPDIGLSQVATFHQQGGHSSAVYHQWQLTTLRSGLGW